MKGDSQSESRSGDRSAVNAHRPGQLLVVENLGKSYAGKSEPAIQGIDFSIGRGEVLGLVGLNGAGKTTTIRIAAGLIRPSSGRVLVAGHEMLREKELASRRVGLVPENPMFDPVAKPLPLLRYFAGFYGHQRGPSKSRSVELLGEVGLADAMSTRFGAFSLGMKKRFAIAAALVGEPEVLLLDETLNGLDPEGLSFVRDAIRKWRDEGKAVLLSSHQLNEIQSLSNRIAVIHRGRCIRVLAPDSLANGQQPTLRVSIEDLDERALSYLADYGTVRREGLTVWVHDFRGKPSDISFELARRGYHLSKLDLQAPSLEDVFFDLILEESQHRPSPAADDEVHAG
jgi:ABC-2 type transport system ATP-binding protein